jgi:hypothetical protein
MVGRQTNPKCSDVTECSDSDTVKRETIDVTNDGTEGPDAER